MCLLYGADTWTFEVHVAKDHGRSLSQVNSLHNRSSDRIHNSVKLNGSFQHRMDHKATTAGYARRAKQA